MSAMACSFFAASSRRSVSFVSISTMSIGWLLVSDVCAENRW
jgi:hypothetical protein